MNTSGMSVDNQNSKLASSSSPAPIPQISKASKRTKISWVGLLPTLFIIGVSAGIATLIIVWLVVHRFRLEDLETRQDFRSPAVEGFWALDEGFKNVEGKKGVNGMVAVMHILTFSVIASHLVPVSSSILMILVAYRTAAQWLRASENGGAAEGACPTPLQYGLLLRLLGGSGITALYKTLRYTHKHDRAQLPPIFVQATVIAVIIFFLTHLVGVADIWLHAVASSIIVDFPNRLPPQDHILWSVGLNSSDPKAFGLCSPWTGSPWPCLDTPAGWADATDLNDTELIIAYTGWQTAYNITDLATFTTVQLPNQDNSALLMPWSAGTGANFSTYRATTYGANATCTIITNKCAKDSTSGLTTSCAPAGYPQLPVVGNFPTTADPHPPYEPLVNSTTYSASNPTFTFPSRVLGLVDGHIAGLVSGLADLPPASAITDNPTTTLLQLRWSSFYGNTPLPVISRDGNDPSFDTWPSGFHTLYAACSLEYFTANVTYDPTLPNAWSIESKALVDRNLTSILWSPLMSQYATESLSSEIMGFASSNTLADTTLKLEELLGRLAIAFPSGLFDPAPALSVDLIDTRILGLYPIGPIALLVSALYLYSLFAIFIFVTSQTASSYAVTIPADPPSAEEEKAAGVATPNEAPALGGTNVEEEADALALGQMWLTDPIAFISAMFPEGDGLDGKRSAMTDALLTHKDTTNGSQRLEMGVFGRGEETVFGIRTRGIQEGSG